MRLLKYCIACVTCIYGISLAQPLPQGKRLKELAGTQTKIGFTTSWGSLGVPNLKTVIEREASAGTVLCYPFITWMERNTYDFSKFNETVNYYEEKGMEQIAHLLVGGDYYYNDWFKNGTWTNEQLLVMMDDFIKAIMQSNDNGKKVDVWNVVNESQFQRDRAVPGMSVWRPTHWLKMGYEEDMSGLTGDDKVFDKVPVYIGKAFEISRKYTNNKLELRELRCEWDQAPDVYYNYKPYYQLVKHLLNKGYPVDVVGLQAHMSSPNSHGAYNWASFKEQIRRMKALGVEVLLGEVDCANDCSANGFKLQGETIYNAVKNAREAGIDYINFWGTYDGSNGDRSSKECSLVFKAGWEAKPFYYGAQRALLETQGATILAPSTAPSGLSAKAVSLKPDICKIYSISGRKLKTGMVRTNQAGVYIAAESSSNKAISRIVLNK